MAPLLALVVTTLVARAAGAAGFGPTATWPGALAAGLAAMFALTASAHFSRRRAGLVAIVPPGVPHPAAPYTPLGRRTAMQVLFLAAAVTVAVTPA